jgi:hypothetical protein
MPSWRSNRSHRPESPDAKRRGLSGSRRIVLAAVAGTAIVGTAAGLAAAELTTGTTATPRAISQAQTPQQRPSQGQASHGTTGQGQASHGTNASQGQAASQGQSPITAKLRTSCRSVAHIGDSTTVDLISAASIPDRAQQLQARYADVGVRHLKLDASGGRSIVETLPDQVNGFNVARAWHQANFKGCWVFALGTNDAANIAAGSTVDATARIDQMMSMAHGQPVMWVNTKTMLSSGPYASTGERAWDAALASALHKYPNMRIFDWAAKAKPDWFLSDGIHYNTIGCQARAKAIADALARAFPDGGQSSSQIVR